MKSLLVARAVSRVTAGRLKYGWWTAPYESSASPVVIGGSPRTGSTLLRVMLTNHPALWIGPENGMFQEGGRNLSGLEVATRLSAGEIRRHYNAAGSLGEFVDTLMTAALAREGKPRWGLKSPGVVMATDLVLRYFPRSRFIHIVRDGRDVVASLRNHPKYKVVDGVRVETGVVNPWPWCVREWASHTEAGLRFRDDPRVLEVRYERLVTDAEGEARRVLEWLGLPFDPAVLDYHNRPVNEGNDSPHPGLREAVNTAAMGRWAQDLPREAVEAFDRRACRLLVELGYAVDDAWRDEALAR